MHPCRLFVAHLERKSRQAARPSGELAWAETLVRGQSVDHREIYGSPGVQGGRNGARRCGESSYRVCSAALAALVRGDPLPRSPSGSWDLLRLPRNKPMGGCYEVCTFGKFDIWEAAWGQVQSPTSSGLRSAGSKTHLTSSEGLEDPEARAGRRAFSRSHSPIPGRPFPSGQPWWTRAAHDAARGTVTREPRDHAVTSVFLERWTALVRQGHGRMMCWCSVNSGDLDVGLDGSADLTTHIKAVTRDCRQIPASGKATPFPQTIAQGRAAHEI